MLARQWLDAADLAEAAPKETAEVHALIGRMEAFTEAARIFGVSGIMLHEIERLSKARMANRGGAA